jgi:hypothetical protein
VRKKRIKNVDVKFRVHDTFLEQPLSGTLKIDRLESQIIKDFGSNKTNQRYDLNQIVFNITKDISLSPELVICLSLYVSD